VTDDSAFKKQIRARMAETGENYTVARRMVIAGRDPGQPAVALRVYLNPHVDLELTAEAGRAFAAADEQGRRDMASRLLADHIEMAGFAEARVAAEARVVTDQDRRAEEEAAEQAAIRGAVRRGIERAAGVSAVEVGRAGDEVRVSIRTAQPGVLIGDRGAEADRIRHELQELQELTGKRVRLDILRVPGPLEAPGRAVGRSPLPGAARERDELRELLDERARLLTEARDEQRQRAERAERDLDAARAELARIRQDASTTDIPASARRGRSGRVPEGS
jgi:hypothetical protein